MDTDQKIDALTTLCRHLIDCFKVMLNDDGNGGIKGSIAAKSIAPEIAQAEQILSELYR